MAPKKIHLETSVGIAESKVVFPCPSTSRETIQRGVRKASYCSIHCCCSVPSAALYLLADQKSATYTKKDLITNT